MYVWLRGYKGSEPKMSLVYWIGMAFPNPQGSYGGSVGHKHFDIMAEPSRWHGVRINVARDFDLPARAARFDELGLDRLVVTLGTWVENLGADQPIRVNFDDVSLEQVANLSAESTVDGALIRPKDRSQIWNKRVVHENGEHVFRER